MSGAAETQQVQGAAQGASGKRGGAGRLLLRGALGLTAAGLLFLAIGFGLFLRRLDWAEPTRLPGADGVIVLTGGADRIAEAVSLVAKGYASRLLITGVNQSIGVAEIARLTPEFKDTFDCCIDLGYRAQNTEGNAIEARDWAQARGMTSLIIVTSNYHMPRALLEIRAAMPDIRLTRFSVLPDALKAGAWHQEPAIARLLVVEYLKFLRASARIKFWPPRVTDANVKAASK